MNLTDFKVRLFEKAQTKGFTDVELYYEKKKQFTSLLDQGEVDQFSVSEVMGLSFRGLYDGKMGYAYSEKLDDFSIDFLLDNAKENALILENENQEKIFAGNSNYPDANFYTEELNQFSYEELVEFLKIVESFVYKEDTRVVGTGFLGIQSSEIEKALFNSKGISLMERRNLLATGVSLIVKEGDLTKSGAYEKILYDLSETTAIDIAKKGVNEAISYLNPRSIENRKYKVLLRNDAATAILSSFSPVFSAENVQNGRSLLKDKVGEMIAGDNITLIDDPLHPDGNMSRNFDAEGVATKTVTVVEKGRLNTLFHNQKTAQKEDVETTGHAYKESYKDALTVATSNFYLKPGDQSYDELIKSIDEGVIITELSGLHSGVNEISGDFSIAAKGYYVKDGKVEGATNQLTVAGNFYDLLNDVKQIGSDLELAKRFGSASPSLLINQLSITSE
ncbi:TldD/PmbA family protein [Filobacillus milosensis]|uniref:TldD/PmbA family protein n=1 Tax=Filobacillus milosensis TaxID=94137 RepID=A0A4Y8IEC1_9BACI|nr:TldD/PmbA family protein [Filobacillus milosensis]TFB14260.1 TldD/PmbA family protein [Filobacillus milosensis]